MVYNHLLNLYQVLDKREQELDTELKKISADPGKIQFTRGRHDVIREFREFLKNTYHGKLPRRIQKLHS